MNFFLQQYAENSGADKQTFYRLGEMTLNGNNRIPLTSLNTKSMVSPTILKGKSNTQKIGYRNNTSNARGQHTIRRIHQMIKLRKRFIVRG